MSDNHATFVGVRPAGWLGADAVGAAEAIVDWSVAAEARGFDVVYVGDRLLANARDAAGKPVYDAAMLDPFVLLAAIAARTERVRLATLITVVTFRHPAQLAKLTASLDLVSGGRFVFGAGSGWSPAELRLFGVDAKRRGAQMEEGINLIRRLWTGEPVTEHGEFWTLDDVAVRPRPAQRPGPPVWMASFAPDDVEIGSTDIKPPQRRALQRVGRVADGWVPLTYSAAHKRELSAEQLEAGWRIVVDEAAASGRDPSAIDCIYAHWICVVRNEAERRACEAGLARFFTGSWEDAVATYPIGTPEEIAERIRVQTSRLDRVDGYLFTPIAETEDQLAAIADDLRPLLEGGRE